MYILCQTKYIEHYASFVSIISHISVAELAQQTRQAPHIARVAGKLNIGFVVILLIFMSWADYNLPLRFVLGSQAVGPLEDSHLWSPVDLEEPESEEQLLFERQKLLEEMSKRPLDISSSSLLGLGWTSTSILLTLVAKLSSAVTLGARLCGRS